MSSNSIKVAVCGASGRTGSLLVEAVKQDPELSLVAALVSPNSSKLGLEVGSVCYSSDLEGGVRASDIVIDFSNPSVTFELVGLCSKYAKPIVVATTGHEPSIKDEFSKLADTCQVLMAPNTSLGVYVLRELMLRANQLLGDDFDLEILESHHRNKKDAPSGTALHLAEAISNNSSRAVVYAREGLRGGRGNSEIGITSLRGGDVVGEHTLFFYGCGERLELSHKVSDRSVFARGAILAAKRLLKFKVGLYSIDQVFGAP